MNRVCLVVLLVTITGSLHAQEHEHAAGHSHGLHFAHPMFTESVSPDTKLRFDLGRSWEAEGRESEIEVEGEYAFHRSFSIEVMAPYAALDPEGGSSTSGLGNVEVALKFANYAFESAGVLLGYGVEFGLPTGDATAGTGSDHIWEVAPFFNVGFQTGRVELVAFSVFGIPTNQDATDEFETEFSYDISSLVHVSSRFQGLFEINGHTVLSGDEAGHGLVSVSPAVKFAPLTTSSLFVGVGVNIPLNSDEVDAWLKTSVFYHF